MAGLRTEETWLLAEWLLTMADDQDVDLGQKWGKLSFWVLFAQKS